MESRITYILVGLFVLVFGTLLVAGVLWLGAGGPSAATRDYLVFSNESVSGLRVDAPVRYRGVDMGRVKDIRLDPGNPERVRVLLELDADAPVKTDTVATLETQGLTGIASINLSGGTRDAAPLQAKTGEHYPVIPSAPSLLGRLDDAVSKLLADLTETSERINRLLSDTNQQAISRSLQDLSTLAENLANQSSRLEQPFADLSATLSGTRKAVDQLGSRMGPTLDKIRDAAASVERMAAEFTVTGQQLRKTSSVSGPQLQRFTSEVLPQMGAMVNELGETAHNLRLMSEQLQRDPSVLLYGPGPAVPGPGERSEAGGKER